MKNSAVFVETALGLWDFEFIMGNKGQYILYILFSILIHKNDKNHVVVYILIIDEYDLTLNEKEYKLFNEYYINNFNNK